MRSEVQGVVLFLFGVTCMAFAKPFGRRASAFQARVFRNDVSPAALRRGYLFSGLVFAVVGVLTFFGIMRL